MDGGLHRGPEGDFWTHGMDRGFLMRLYSQASFIGLGLAVLFMAFDQRTCALGLVGGLALGLFSVWTTEVTVKVLFKGGQDAGLKLALGAFIKLPFLLAGLMVLAWASYNRYMNVFAVVGGILLVHATMLISISYAALANREHNTERYR